MYKGIHHVSILVTDMEKSMHFYEEILGFKRSNDRPDFGFAGAWYQLGETQLHLIVHEEGKTLRGTTTIDTKDGHFAIRVQDMNMFIERVTSYGIDVVNKPTNKTEWHQVFISDPDGNVIEFNR